MRLTPPSVIWPALGLLLLTSCTTFSKSPAPGPETATLPVAIEKTAEKSAAAGPALWKIADADTNLYVLGTVHILNKDTLWRNAKIDAAWDDSTVVYFETDLSPAAEQQMQSLIPKIGVNKPGTALSSFFTPEEVTTIRTYAESVGVPLQGLEPLRPWLANVVLGVQAIVAAGGDPQAGVEKILQADALAANKEIRQLETPEQQLTILSSSTDEKSARQILEGIEYAENNPNYFTEIATAWTDGNTTLLAEMVKDGLGTDEEYIEALLYTRNTDWTNQLKDLMDKEAGTFFIAVGAAHLVGEKSVIEMMADQGLIAEKQ